MNKNNVVFILTIISLVSITPIYGLNNTSNLNETPLTHEDMLTQAQKDIDRSLDILNMVTSMLSILIAVIGILITILIGFGFIEIWKGNKIRKKMQGYAEESKPILEWLKNTESEVKALTNQFNNRFNELPSDKEIHEFDELGKNIELLEKFGVPLRAEDYRAQAIDFFYKEDYDSALNAIDIAIKLDANQSPSWFVKGNILYRKSLYKEAITVLDEAIKLDPDLASAWVSKGASLYEIKQFKESIAILDEAIRLDQNIALAWAIKGAALDEIGEHEEAEKAVDKAIELDQNNALAWYNKACIYYCNNKEEDKALEYLSKAIELDPKYKKIAKKDKDFKNLQKNDIFKELVK